MGKGKRKGNYVIYDWTKMLQRLNPAPTPLTSIMTKVWKPHYRSVDLVICEYPRPILRTFMIGEMGMDADMARMLV
jgi:hypothetical protein